LLLDNAIEFCGIGQLAAARPAGAYPKGAKLLTPARLCP
jgi:hypothetical protein